MTDAEPGGTWRGVFDLYFAVDVEAEWIRGQHLTAVLRLSPYLMAANVFNATIVGLIVAPRTPLLFALWALGVAVLATNAMRAWWRSRRRAAIKGSQRALRRATWHAAVLGAAWAAVPVVWFSSAAPPERLLIATLTTGMMAAGAFALAPLPAASIAYVAVLFVGSQVSLWHAGEPVYLLVALLLCAYTAICVLASLAIGHKATALLRSQHEAARQQQMVALLLRDFEEHAADALWETDAAGLLTHTSARLATLLAFEIDALPLKNLVDLIRASSPDGAEALRDVLSQGRSFRDISIHSTDDGRSQWWLLSGKPMLSPTGQVSGWRGVIADATAEVQAKRRLSYMAHFDSLTGLANRSTLHEALRAALQAGAPCALLSIDLDNFKAVNDTLGHSAGDDLLKAVGERLQACVRSHDLVARLAGDEFAVLVRLIEPEGDALSLAQRMVVRFAEPCRIASRTLTIGVSVGVASLPEHGRHVDEALGNADLALYEAKQSGRGRAALYDPRLGERGRRRATLEQGLKYAIGNRELSLHWQPQVDVATWRIVGVEALLRWNHATLGSVPPAEFIPIAERTGAIDELGGWVLAEACRSAADHLPGIPISVNVSSAQLLDESLAGRLRAALAETGLAPSRLELEITESIFIDDVVAAVARLRGIKGLGVRISLDDFGTGYSSLAHLRRFPFDTLKIDQAFVRELLPSADVRAIVRTIVQLAGTLGMRTVAEGIESREQLEVVAGLGCTAVQGYLVSRPTDLPTLVQFIAQWSGQRPASDAGLCHDG